MQLSTIQRIIHLKLQGFSVPKIAEMQNVSKAEVEFVCHQNQDSVFACDAPFIDRIKMSNEKK